MCTIPQICSSLCENWMGAILAIICCTYFTKSDFSSTEKNDNVFLKSFETSVAQHCFPSQHTPMCQIWAQYHKLCHGKGQNFLLWLQTYRCSYLIDRVVNDLFQKFIKTHVYYLSLQLVHKWWVHARGIFLSSYSLYLNFFKKWPN